MTTGTLRTVICAGVACAALSACAPSAQIVADVTNLDTVGSKTITDIVAFSHAPSVQNGAVLAADAGPLESAITQLRTDLGSTAPSAKVAAALDSATKLAEELKTVTPAEAPKIVADAQAAEAQAHDAEGGL